MKSFNRQSTAPLAVPRTRRQVPLSGLTSLPAGRCVPLAAIPMLREDALNASLRINVEMLETAELLMNRVNLRVTAYVVPWLAMERFEGSRDQFDRSYMGQPQVEGGAVVPFVETHAMGAHGSNAVYKALGLHAKPIDQVNTMYLEAYNAIWNFRAENRSPDLMKPATKRTRLQADLAPAFWMHSRFAHIVPDFDQAVIDGEVALNVASSDLTLRGTDLSEGTTAAQARVRHYGDVSNTQEYLQMAAGGTQTVRMSANIAGASDLLLSYVDLQEIVAELEGVTVSLSKLEQAKKAQWFAKLREKFAGHDDEYIIDMLMGGLVIPDQALKSPVLIADRTVPFAQAKRYATDAANLAESAVSGGAMLDLRLRVPRLNVGGVVMVIAECVPEQLFERQRDPFFFASNARDGAGELQDFPSYLRDEMDDQKVDTVLNGEIDTDHASPGSTFGYEPMWARWARGAVRIGGKFYRPTTNTATDEERQRLWAVETVNPALSADFYIVGAIHTKPFLDTEAEPFEATVAGNVVVEGNTVFGPVLVEATGNYDKVMEKAPDDQIELP